MLKREKLQAENPTLFVSQQWKSNFGAVELNASKAIIKISELTHSTSDKSYKRENIPKLVFSVLLIEVVLTFLLEVQFTYK